MRNIPTSTNSVRHAEGGAMRMVLGMVCVLFCVVLAGAGCTESGVVTQGTSQDGSTAPDNAVPTDWVRYESDLYDLSFDVPAGWVVREDEKLGILLSDIELPAQLPPDVLGVPVVIGDRGMSLVEIKDMLSGGVSEELIENGQAFHKFTHDSGVDMRKLFAVPVSGRYITIGTSMDVSDRLVMRIVSQISSR